MTVIAADAFTGTSGDQIGGRATTGGTWSRMDPGAADQVVISSSGTAAQILNTGVAFRSARLVWTATPSSADYEVSATFSTPDPGVGGRCAVLVRCGADDSDYGYRLDLNLGSGELRLYKHWSTIQVAGASYPPTADVPFTLTLRAVGTALTGYVNGVEAVSGADSDITAVRNGGFLLEYTGTIENAAVQSPRIDAWAVDDLSTPSGPSAAATLGINKGFIR